MLSRSSRPLSIVLVSASILIAGSLLYLQRKQIRKILFENEIFLSVEALNALHLIDKLKLAISTFENDLAVIEKDLGTSMWNQDSNAESTSHHVPNHTKPKIIELSTELDFILSNVDSLKCGNKKGSVYDRIKFERKFLANKCATLGIRVDSLVRML